MPVHLKNFYIREFVDFKKKEKEFLQHAEYTISLTENGKIEIESCKLPNQSPIKVIPCCTDENFFQTKNISDKRDELGIKKDGNGILNDRFLLNKNLTISLVAGLLRGAPLSFQSGINSSRALVSKQLPERI